MGRRPGNGVHALGTLKLRAVAARWVLYGAAVPHRRGQRGAGQPGTLVLTTCGRSLRSCEILRAKTKVAVDRERDQLHFIPAPRPCRNTATTLAVNAIR